MITPPPLFSQRRNGHVPSSAKDNCLRLVAVSSEGPHAAITQPAPAVSFRLKGFAAEPHRVRYTRIAAHTLGRSAAWMLQRSGKCVVSNRLTGAVVMAPGGVSNLPQSHAGILELLEQEEGTRPDHKAIAAAIVELRSADAAIAGPFSPEDALAPALVPHLAELASRAYRALRPSAELIAHRGFGQLARRFAFIQMSHEDARWLGGGAIDIGTLAQCLRQLQGRQGEFAITSFCGSGVLSAEDRWWEIEPVGGDVDGSRAGASFCLAWVVARRFLRASAAQALAYARSAAVNSAGAAGNTK
jgi:hypothetical protein